MREERPETLEDKLAARLARLGTYASIISLLVLLAVIFGNVLVLALRVAVNFVLAVLVNQGPAAAAILAGLSTWIGYYGRTRLLRRKEKFNLRDEARDQAMDQAGNVLQNAPAALRSRLGCSSSLSLGVFGFSLILCLLTYLPPPLHVFGANIAAATATATSPTTTPPTVPATTGTVAISATATTMPTTPPQPTATAVPTTTIVHAPAATRVPTPTPIPTATPVPPPPGHLLILPPTSIDLSYYCGYPFGHPGDSTTNIFFAFTNNGGSTVYWTVEMPTGILLEPNYPTSGTLLPNEGDSQNEYIQGKKEDATITIAWGLSAANEPFTASVPVTCTNPPG